MSATTSKNPLYHRTSRECEQSEAFDEMARDEARHGKTFAGLLQRYFG